MEIYRLVETLTGHTTQDTAYLVDDYPYGYRLRCKIRYWLEYKASQGFRLMSQTTNPKKAGEVWNKPKASVYHHLAVMGLNEENHVTWTGIQSYNMDEIEEFESIYGATFDENQKRVCLAIKLAKEAYEKRKKASS